MFLAGGDARDVSVERSLKPFLRLCEYFSLSLLRVRRSRSFESIRRSSTTNSLVPKADQVFV